MIITFEVKEQKMKKCKIDSSLQDKNITYFCISIICTPSCPQWLLPTQIPHNKMNIPPHNFFHIGPNCWTSVHNLIHKKLIENGGFSCIVKANNDNFMLYKTKRNLITT